MQISKEPAVFVFDVDGCIMDSFNYFMKFVPEVYAQFGINPDETLIQRMREEIIQMLTGKSSKLLIARMLLHSAKMMGLRPFQRLKFLTFLNALYKQKILSVNYVPGALETIQALKNKGYRIALFTTGSMKDFTLKFHEKQDLVNLLDDFIVRDHVKHMKPDPEGLNLIKQHLGITNPRHLVMVGDMHHDIQAGLAAGGIAIGVKTGVCTEAELHAAGATIILESVADILPDLARIEAEMDG
jgi:HAD superfamily hydrolase (TIGR01509 family)